MRGIALSLIVVTGCYAGLGVHGHVGVRGPDPLAVVATAITVAAIATAVATAPPVAVSVEYYDYGARPGYVWVNPHYVYASSGWVWQAGYWQDDRPGYYWVQGGWQWNGYEWIWRPGHYEPDPAYSSYDGSYDGGY